MANIIILVIFICFAVGHIIGEFLKNLKIRYITKPLLMPLLALYYFIDNSSINWWILLGIIGGFGGDVLLMISESDPNKSENFFTFGLISFLLGHLFYIIGLVQLTNSFVSFQLWTIILMIPYILFIAIAAIKLLPAVGEKEPDMKIPVTIYLVIIGIMGVSSVLPLFAHTGAILLMIGAFMFMVSDSVLAFNKFKKEIPYERIIVMTTYILAQFFIVQGALLL